jgi:hypothetical protein
MNICMFHWICDSIVGLYNYIVHTRLSLVGKVVLDTQPRVMCKLVDDLVPLVMGMVMLIQLTLALLKSLASRTDPILRCNKQVVICMSQSMELLNLR